MENLQDSHNNLFVIQEKIIKTDEVLRLLDAKKKEVNKLEKKYKKILDKFCLKNNEVVNLAIEYQNLSKRLTVCTEIHLSWEKEIKELKLQNEYLEQNNNDYVNNAEKKYQSACQEILTLNETCDKLNKKIEKFEQKDIKIKCGKKLQDGLSELKEQLKENVSKYDELQCTTNKTITDLKQECKHHQEQQNKTLKHLAKAQLECSELKKSLENSKNSPNKLKLQEKVKELETKLKFLKQETDILKQSHENDIAQLKKQHEEEKKLLEKLNNTNEEKSKRENNAAELAKKYENEKILLEKQLDNLKDKIREEYGKHENEKKCVEDQVEKLKVKINEFNKIKINSETQTEYEDLYNLDDILTEMHDSPALMSPLSPVLVEDDIPKATNTIAQTFDDSYTQTCDYLNLVYNKIKVKSLNVTTEVFNISGTSCFESTDSSAQTDFINYDSLSPNARQCKIQVRSFKPQPKVFKEIPKRTCSVSTETDVLTFTNSCTQTNDCSIKNDIEFTSVNTPLITLPKSNIFEQIPKNVKLKSRITKKYKISNNKNRLFNTLRNSKLNLKCMLEKYMHTNSKFVIVSSSILKSDFSKVKMPEVVEQKPLGCTSSQYSLRQNNDCTCSCQQNMFRNTCHGQQVYQIPCACIHKIYRKQNNYCKMVKQFKCKNNNFDDSSDSEDESSLHHLFHQYKHFIIKKYLSNKYWAKLAKQKIPEKIERHVFRKNILNKKKLRNKFNRIIYSSDSEEENYKIQFDHKNINDKKRESHSLLPNVKMGMNVNDDTETKRQFLNSIINENINLTPEKQERIKMVLNNENENSLSLNKESITPNNDNKYEKILNNSIDLVSCDSHGVKSNKINENLEENKKSQQIKSKKKKNVKRKILKNVSGIAKINIESEVNKNILQDNIFQKPENLNVLMQENTNIAYENSDRNTEDNIDRNTEEHIERITEEYVDRNTEDQNYANTEDRIDASIEDHIYRPEEIILTTLDTNTSSTLEENNQSKIVNKKEEDANNLHKTKSPFVLSKKQVLLLRKSKLLKKGYATPKCKVAQKKISRKRKLSSSSEDECKKQKLELFGSESDTDSINTEEPLGEASISIIPVDVSDCNKLNKNVTISHTVDNSNITQKPKSPVMFYDLNKEVNVKIGTDVENDHSYTLVTKRIAHKKLEKCDTRMSVDSSLENIAILSSTNVSNDESPVSVSNRMFKKPERCKMNVSSNSKMKPENDANNKDLLKTVVKTGTSERLSNTNRERESESLGIEKLQHMNLSLAQKLLNDVVTKDYDKELMASLVASLVDKDSTIVSRLIVNQAAKDFTQEYDKSFTPPAPLLTVTQQKMLILFSHLENNNLSNIYNIFLQTLETRLFSETRVEVVHPLTRLYVAVCKLKYEIEKVRILCCNAAYYMGDLFLPLMFIVLTMWGDILPMADHSEDIPLAISIVHVIQLKTCKEPGYNFLNLNRLLSDYYGYKRGEQSSDDIMNKLIRSYSETYSTTAYTAIVILCKNLSHKWTYTQIKNHLLPLVERTNNTENKMKAVSLIQRLITKFQMNSDLEYIIDIKKCLSKFVIHPGAAPPIFPNN